MPRIRTIKPEFWRNSDLAKLSEFTRLVAIAVLNLADDEGYFEADARLVRGDVFPFEESSVRTHGALTELCVIGYLQIVTTKTKGEIGYVCNFAKHQVINRPTPSKLSKCFHDSTSKTNETTAKPQTKQLFTEYSRSTHGVLTEDAVLEREQGTGKGNRELCVSAKHTTQTEKTKHNYPEDFESFWNNYPRLRRKQKLTALTAWKSALKKTTSENLISKGIEYANSETGRGDFVAMPATWLNGGCWDDDPQSWNPTEKTAKCEVMNPDDYNLKKMGPEAFARMKADERARGLST